MNVEDMKEDEQSSFPVRPQIVDDPIYAFRGRFMPHSLETVEPLVEAIPAIQKTGRYQGFGTVASILHQLSQGHSRIRQGPVIEDPRAQRAQRAE
jgi:hypothetical protein